MKTFGFPRVVRGIALTFILLFGSCVFRTPATVQRIEPNGALDLSFPRRTEVRHVR